MAEESSKSSEGHPSDTHSPWPYDLSEHEVTWPLIFKELNALGAVDGNGHTDPDRINHWASVEHLVSGEDLANDDEPEEREGPHSDEVIARVVRTAVRLVRRFDHLTYSDGQAMLSYELAFEVAMIWEFG